jgi:chromosome segregation ATPase
MADPTNFSNDVRRELDELTQETTAAELVRQRGQHQRLKTISERKLLEWVQRAIGRELDRALAARQEMYSDDEKRRIQEQALASVQSQLAQYREASRQADQRAGELQSRYQVAVQAAEGNRELQDALRRLQEQANEAENRAGEQAQELFDLEERFNQNAQLLHTTIAEKEKLQTTNHDLLLRAGELVQGVMDVDAEFYGRRHQVAAEQDSNHDDSFFADYVTSQQVIVSLAQDLRRLHTSAHVLIESKPQEHDTIQSEMGEAGTSRMSVTAGQHSDQLTADLAIIEEIQSGSFGGKGAVNADQAQLLLRIADSALARAGVSLDADEEDSAPADPGDALQLRIQAMQEALTEQVSRNQQLVNELNQGSEARRSLEDVKVSLEHEKQQREEDLQRLRELADLGKEMVPILSQKIERLEKLVADERTKAQQGEAELSRLRRDLAEATEAEVRLAETLATLRGLAMAAAPGDANVEKCFNSLDQRLSQVPDVEPGSEAAPIRPHLLSDLAADGVAIVGSLARVQERQQKQVKDLAQRLEEASQETNRQSELVRRTMAQHLELSQEIESFANPRSTAATKSGTQGFTKGSGHPEKPVTSTIARNADDSGEGDDLVLVCEPSLDDAEAAFAEARKAASNLGEQLKQSRERLLALETELASGKDESARLKASLQARQTELGNLQKLLQDRETEKDQIAEELATTCQKLESLTGEHASLTAALTEANSRAQALARDLSAERDARALANLATEEEHAAHTKTQEQAAAREAALQADITQAQERITQIQTELATLVDTKSALEQQLAHVQNEVLTLEAMQRNMAETLTLTANEQAKRLHTSSLEAVGVEGLDQAVAKVQDLMGAESQDSEASSSAIYAATESLVLAIKDNQVAISERLQSVLDDLANIKTEKAAVEGKLEQTRQLADKRQERGRELQGLLKQAKAALDAYKARETVGSTSVQSQVEKVQAEIIERERNAERKVYEAQNRIQDLEESLAESRTRIQSLEEHLAAADSDRVTLVAQLDAGGDQRVEVKALESRLATLEERNRALMEEHQKAAANLGRMNQLAEEIKASKQQRDAAQERVRALESQFASERSKTEGLGQSKESLKREYEARFVQVQERLSAAQTDLAKLRQELAKRDEDNAALTARLRSLTAVDDIEIPELE